MSTFWAELDELNTIRRVLVGEKNKKAAKKWIDDNLGGHWLEVFPNGGPGKYASVDYVYREDLDAFIPPKPTEDATLDETTFSWIVPEVEEPDEA
jgi:hypothetical protein